MVVKIGSAGDVHVDFKPSGLEAMQDAVTRINQAGGIVVYYSEAPNQKASEAAMATFKKLVELKPRILLSADAEKHRSLVSERSTRPRSAPR